MVDRDNKTGEVDMSDIQFRDKIRQCEVELERNEAGDVIAVHLVFDEPRPVSDFIRYDLLLFGGYPPHIPVPPGIRPGHSPCGGNKASGG